MVLDSVGYPHFLAKQQFYPEGSDNAVRTIEYSRWDGSAWKTQTVTSNVSIVNRGLLALDLEDRPHILYISFWPEQVMYARWTGTEWETHHVDGYGGGPQYGYSFALDSSYNPHISYIRPPWNSSYWIRQLKYATATLPQLPSLQPQLNISITLPENKSYSTNEVPLNFTTNKQHTSITYSLNGEANVTITGNTTLTGLPDGEYSIVVYANDTDDNTGTSTVNFSVDTPPTISLLSPQNTTYNSANIPLNFTVNQPTKQLLYSLDAQNNITITGNTNITDLPNGTHNITIYATDETGNTGASDTIHFTVEKPEQFPTTYIAVAFTVTSIIIAAGLIVYFKKRKQ
jgi:hypothetical protein